MTTSTTQTTQTTEVKQEGTSDMNTQDNVTTSNPQASNSSLTTFVAIGQDIVDNNKSDVQELTMIVGILEAKAEFPLSTVTHLIKGDTELFPIPPRKNATAKTPKPKPSADNQQQGALRKYMPVYAELCVEVALGITNKAKEISLAKANHDLDNLTEKQALKLITGRTDEKNMSRSKAELDKQAIEQMFERALKKAYYLLRSDISDPVLDKKHKKLVYTAKTFSIGKDKNENAATHLSENYTEHKHYLGELGRNAEQMLKLDGVINARGQAKGPNKTKEEKAADKKAAEVQAAAAAAELNPLDTAIKNSSLYSKALDAIAKDSAKAIVFRKDKLANAAFASMFKALFVVDNVLDVKALDKAIGAACMNAKVHRVHIVDDINSVKSEKKAEEKQAS